ncbi:MAG: hypothetical protein IPO37_01180 [Saprospiraceae bacterium]|nr:hypothetical protein [Saprospiraceae bacterium]
MKSPQHIQIEGIENDKSLLDRPDVQKELYSQTGSQQIYPDKYVLGVIRNFYEDTQLPFELDYIFQMNNTTIYELTKVTIRGCINNQTKFHTKLWQGYNHLAIIEFDRKSPKIFDVLKPYNERERWDPVLVLCKSNDSERCKESIRNGLDKHEEFMKENNYERWKVLKQEEEEYKRKNK